MFNVLLFCWCKVTNKVRKNNSKSVKKKHWSFNTFRLEKSRKFRNFVWHPQPNKLTLFNFFKKVRVLSPSSQNSNFITPIPYCSTAFLSIGCDAVSRCRFALLSVAFSFTYCCFLNYTTKVTFFADNTKQKVLKK